MNRDFIGEFLRIDNERDAWAFSQRYLAHLQKDPELGRFPPEEIFLSDLRWCFGEDNLEQDIPFDGIQMWAKVAARLVSQSKPGARKIGHGTKLDCALKVVDSRRKPIDQAIDKVIEIAGEVPWSLQPNVPVHTVVDLSLLEAFKTAEGRLAEQQFFNMLNVMDGAARLFDLANEWRLSGQAFVLAIGIALGLKMAGKSGPRNTVYLENVFLAARTGAGVRRRLELKSHNRFPGRWLKDRWPGNESKKKLLRLDRNSRGYRCVSQVLHCRKGLASPAGVD